MDEGAIRPLAGVQLALDPGAHPFHSAHHAAARANWAIELARQPRLFDGTVALASHMEIADDVLAGRCHFIPFSTFLYWRTIRPVPDAIHVFAMPLPISADGALIAVRMAATTANPGRIYCPSGSFDADDLVDGHFDPAVNMIREVREETGLDLAAAEAAPQYHALAIGGVVVVLRVFRLAETADRLMAQIARHVAAEAEPEIDEAVAVRSPSDVTADFAFHMPPVVAWFFGARPS